MGEILDFEPYSDEIFLRLKRSKTAKERNSVFEAVFNHPCMVAIGGTNNLVRIASGHKTASNWQQTLRMAKALAGKGIPTAFLPEKDNEISADAISKINGQWQIVDFKYCASTNWNTIQGNLTKAFKQSQCAIIQLINADAGQFKYAVEYMRRNRIHLKDIVIMNRYGKFISMSFKDLKNGKYANKIKGLL